MAATPGLTQLGGKRPLLAYIRDVWERRDFAVEIAVGEIRSQHMNTVLGNLWHILNPILQVAVYALVFGYLLNVTRGVPDGKLIPFLAVGVFSFHYSQKAITAGAKSLPSNIGLIRSIQFPRAIIPISTVLGHTLAFLPAIALMLVIGLVYGEPIRPEWMFLIPIFAAQVLFTLGMAFIGARITDVFPDFTNLLPFLFRLTFYMSGVIYLVESRFMEDYEEYLWLFDLNPFYAFLTLARWPVLGFDFKPQLVLSVSLWTIAAFVIGFLYFRGGEERYGRG